MTLYALTLRNLTTNEPRPLDIEETSFESARHEAFTFAFREWGWHRVGVLAWTEIGEEMSA